MSIHYPAVFGEQPTVRELEALSGVSRGLTNEEIGRELFLSANTIKTHLCRLFKKIGAKDRANAVTIGFQRGFLELPGSKCSCGLGEAS